MRPLLLTALACIGLYATLSTNPSDIRLIDRLDECMQRRFAAPLPDALGMSRATVPSSFGRHFQPIMNAERDFQPNGPLEENLIREMEKAGLQVGFYLFGTAVEKAAPDALNFRALKGPGAITRGTRRPAWYPGFPPPGRLLIGKALPAPDPLPDWKAIYPVARGAMRSFQDGGKGFDSRFESWHIAARPLFASQQTCVSCHNNPAYRPITQAVKLNQAIGGVLYAYRRAQQ